MDAPVDYQVSGGVAWLTINRPEARNALNNAVRQGLWAGFRRFQDDDNAHVLVLTGAGDVAFCAGGDLKEMADLGMKEPDPLYLPVLGTNIHLSKPVIAAVNGYAYGGGFLLAQMCDLCIASETAKFAVTEARLGRGAPWAAPLPWLISPRNALELLLTGEAVTAKRAYEIGLVNRVVPAASLHESAESLAATIAANAPLSVRASKEMVYAVRGQQHDAAHRIATDLWRPVYLSDDSQEGPRAFQQGRVPAWRGR
jgi:enoyl-CoA hydratase/carnithine racemase